MIVNFGDKHPDFKKAAFVAENAVLVGGVKLEAGSSVWYGAVLRADDDNITVGKNSNIQDGCVVHCNKNIPTAIGDNVTIGHGAVLHGCTIGDGSLVGMNSTVLDGAEIGKGCVIGAGSVVTENKKFDDFSLIIGIPARAVGKIDAASAEEILKNASEYLKKAEAYSAATADADKK